MDWPYVVWLGLLREVAAQVAPHVGLESRGLLAHAQLQLGLVVVRRVAELEDVLAWGQGGGVAPEDRSCLETPFRLQLEAGNCSDPLHHTLHAGERAW